MLDVPLHEIPHQIITGQDDVKSQKCIALMRACQPKGDGYEMADENKRIKCINQAERYPFP